MLNTSINNIIIFDWLAFVTYNHTYEEIISFLGLTDCPFTVNKGRYGYKNMLYFDGISVMFDGSSNMGVLVQFSGQGCRNFETFGTGNYDVIFNMILSNEELYHITRLDIACDDKTGMLDINKIVDDTVRENFSTQFRSYTFTGGSGGFSVCFGSRQSEIIIRIYDKAAERCVIDSVPHWVRCEIQLKHERALNYIKMLHDFQSGQLFCLVLNKYIRFLEPNFADSVKSRWLTANYWFNFLCCINDKISIYTKPESEYNISNLKHYVFDTSMGAIKTTIDILGWDSFIAHVLNFDKQRNPKYLNLLQKYNFLQNKKA